MIVPALDNNPRRIKQFWNLFRFQRTIGLKTGLFAYNKETSRDQMWNCKKLAKFIALCINWPNIISTFYTNLSLLDDLQILALNPKLSVNKNLEDLSKDKKLIELLKYGCVEDNQQRMTEYTLVGLNYTKLLETSPIVAYIESNQDEESNNSLIINVVSAKYKSVNWYNQKYPLITIFEDKYVPFLSKNDPIWQSNIDKLAKLVLDSNENYTLKSGEKLDLGQGYGLQAKQIDVDGKKVWLQFDKDGQFVDDQVISTETNDPTWTCELDMSPGIKNVPVLKVHINNIFQGASNSIFQIDGLWLIDYANMISLSKYDSINGFSILSINKGKNASELGTLILAKPK
jgi:S-layer protein (TIGR01567 family)